jgi:hypothetical protein
MRPNYGRRRDSGNRWNGCGIMPVNTNYFVDLVPYERARKGSYLGIHWMPTNLPQINLG